MISTVVIHAPLITVACRLTNSDQILVGGGSRYSLMPNSLTANSQTRNSTMNMTNAPTQRRLERRRPGKALLGALS